MDLCAAKFRFARNTSVVRLVTLSKSNSARRGNLPRSFNYGAFTNFRVTGHFATSYPFKSNETRESMTARFRSSMPANRSATVLPRAFPSLTPASEKTLPLITELSTNLCQQRGSEASLMRDHVNALTKLTEDALRLIIPYPHFRGHQDYTTLVNDEIKKTTSGKITAEESDRVISGLRKMLSHYEDEAELLSMDVLEGYPQTDSHPCVSHSDNGVSPPNESLKRHLVPKLPEAMNVPSEYSYAAINTAVRDLVRLREAAMEHAEQRSCSFNFIIKRLGTTIDAARCVHLGGLTTLEKILEAKYLVDDRDFYTEKLVAEVEAACPLLSSHQGQNDDNRKDALECRTLGFEVETKQLHLQKKELESMIQRLFAENSDLRQQKREYLLQEPRMEASEDQIHRLEAMAIRLDSQMKIFEDQVSILEAEKIDLRVQNAELERLHQRLEGKNMELESDLRSALGPAGQEAHFKDH